MATIVNNPSGGNDNGAGGWIVAIVVIIILILLALFLFPNLFNDAADEVDITPPVTAPTGETGEGGIPPIINNTFNSTTTIDSATTTE